MCRGSQMSLNVSGTSLSIGVVEDGTDLVFNTQQLLQHLEQQEVEYDDEEPLITPATSNTIFVELEDLELDEGAVDLREREEIEALYSSGCCAKKCHTQVEKDDLMTVRWDLQELTKDQLETTVLGHMMSSTSCETVERNRTEVHGNTGRIPCHAGIKDVVAFLENYAEDYATLLPGRIPG
uniref:Uncharacterized protein n=1 Tax=Amphimedon queenslandica TaxID=400682 RepID=A0A1X7V552_AMPQE